MAWRSLMILGEELYIGTFRSDMTFVGTYA